ncbi:fatty acid desaturase [Streptomyces sp. B-S-A8]|uniref:Fatty acid desaturase n=1 Tax=Streptomyces solicavernae TaxID=3043614 RepID=A0ABT6S145_9ACTN|nr:fatty acid desaturase [Streptomyces sp. B-S-A8]MDI3389606.1 fatty acid desaturase [Streptomyces sp. B-S-A8]
MSAAIALIVVGLLLRQLDRVRHLRKPRTLTAAEAMSLQRTRATVWVPALLLAGEWIQIAGWWLLAGVEPLLAVLAAVAVGVHFRHLQEISHFAVHGVLARGRRANVMLAEVFVHLPMALGPVSERRTRHVRDHHPNATVGGVDPNLEELRAAGLVPGAARGAVTRAAVHPLTLRGLRDTVSGLGQSLARPERAAAVVLVAVAAYAVGGWTGLVAGVIVPRLWLYPQLAWLSLLGEHTWFDPQRRTGSRAEIEAGRCLRLYPEGPVLAAVAAVTWLPYGDLHHYAHSAHPAVRWNYLPAVERELAPPHCTPAALLLGSGSLLARHRRALAGEREASAGVAARGGRQGSLTP